MKLEYYKTALQNIQLARNNNYPESKLEKLTEREQRCLSKIRAGITKEDSYQRNKDAKNELLGPTLPANEKFPFYVAHSLYLDNSDAFGFHIRTNEDLKTGTLVASERLLTTALLDGKESLQYCEYCKNRSLLNLFPCDSCKNVMYCSEKCRQDAYTNYHKYLCGVDCYLMDQISCTMKLFCLGLNSFANPTEFADFLRETENSDATGWKTDFRGMDRNEVNKNLFLIMNSFKNYNYTSRSKDEDIRSFKELTFVLSVILRDSKLKDVLVTEDLKAMLRNFVFRQIKFYSHYYTVLCAVVRSDEKTYFRGILSLTNYFNMSCDPNIFYFFDDSEVRFVTLRPIKKGEQLFIGIAGLGVHFMTQPVEIRRGALLNFFGFVCSCEACEHPEAYPLSATLRHQIKDPGAFCHSLNPSYLKELEMLKKDDIDVAMKHFRLACNYMDKVSADIYPSYETIDMLDCLMSCFHAFCAHNEIS
jgi:hypothetical protein